MSEPSTNTEAFDVFLCHNNEDKLEIREIARQLAENGIKPWLDEEQIRPGTSWQTALGEQISTINSAAVFVGESGVGPWQDQEIQALLSQFVKRKCPVIPVVLPSAKETPKLPWTLENLNWADFRIAKPEPLKQLIWGITGEKPDKTDDLPKDPSCPDSDIPQETELFPPKEKKVIELRLSGDLDEFTDEAKMVLLESLNKLMNIGDVKLTKVSAGSVRLYLELDPEDADKLYSADKEGRLVDLGISEARLYPAIAEPPEEDQRAQLLILLDRVNEYWIEGVLKHSLYNEVLISLGKHAMDEAVEPPWKHFVELPRQRRHLILQDRSIRTVFDATGLLLILGEPGSGKTTTLLDLASELIARAKKDPKERVPIVLNLSSWKKKQTLDEWIVKELSAKYRVPIKIGRFWLKNDYILPLLDGLDEVQNSLRPACVVAINEFIDEFGSSGVVVCCRLMEYQWLPERLKLNGAICLELLGSDEVNEFLTSGGEQLSGLRQAMSVDPVLQELSQSPLMLSIMSLAYKGLGVDDLAIQKSGSHEERQEQLFNLYVQSMFQRKEMINSSFSKNKVIDWLARSAKGMKEHSKSVFMVEELQPSWLSTRGQRIAYGTLTALIVAFLCMLSSLLIYGLIFGLLYGMGVGADRFYLGLNYGLRLGLIAAREFGWSCGVFLALFGVITSVVAGGSLKEIRSVEKLRWSREAFFNIANLLWALLWTFFLIIGMIYGKSTMVIFVIYMGLIALTGRVYSVEFNTVRVEKTSPNKAIYLSMKNGTIASLIFGLLSGLQGLLFFKLIFGRSFLSDSVLNYSLLWGLVGGWLGGLLCGWSAVVKHYSLRFILWINGYTPFNFIKFLDHCAKLILLKKVGGGYMFIHRMLLEHFAKMELKSTNIKKSK